MKDDSNPMHKIGYGRGDDAPQPVRRMTAAYSFVEPRVEQKKPQPTVIMDEPLAPVEKKVTPTDMNKIMFELVERDFDAWMRLPDSVRKLMVTCPQDFTLHSTDGGVPHVIHCGVEFAFDGGVWTLVGIQ